jgi:hypothetical protein
MGRLGSELVLGTSMVLGDATAQSQQGGTSTGSWTPYVTAAVGLLGALIGGAVSLWGGQLTWKRQQVADTVRWAHENQTRFHERRRELYARFLASLAEILPGARSLSTRRQEASAAKTSWPATERERQRLGELVGKEQELVGLRWEISVIGSNPVKEAAEYLHELQLRAFNAAVEGTQQDWPMLNQEFEASAARFVDATREELGEPP